MQALERFTGWLNGIVWEPLMLVLIALILLGPVVFRLTQEYFSGTSRRLPQS